MALRSKLLSGDPKLEACLLHDSAHVTPGTVGPHVAKIQTALAFLDDAHIPTAEFSGMRYGAGTAAAVLAYKRERKIINLNYQTHPDNIVGKMTIAALDGELVARQWRTGLPGCGDAALMSGSRPTAPSGSAHSILAFGIQGGPNPLFNVKLDTLWQVTTSAAKVAASRHMVYWTRGNELFRPYQMTIVSSVAAPPDMPFPFEMTVDPANYSDIVTVRKAAGAARGAPDSVYRVIVCQFENSANSYFATTEGGILLGENFPAFTLINANVLRPDHCTLAHEMVHAADLRLTIAQHDPDPDNVFSVGSNRRNLTANWARVISQAYFARPG